MQAWYKDRSSAVSVFFPIGAFVAWTCEPPNRGNRGPQAVHLLRGSDLRVHRDETLSAAAVMKSHTAASRSAASPHLAPKIEARPLPCESFLAFAIVTTEQSTSFTMLHTSRPVTSDFRSHAMKPVKTIAFARLSRRLDH